MPISHSFAVSPTATAPVAYAAGVGQHKKWLSELEQGYAQMWQQAQGQAASASNRLFSQVLEQQAAQSRQATGAMLNESAAQSSHQRQQVMQQQGYQYDQGLRRMSSGLRMQEQDNAGRISENAQFTKQAIQTRTNMNEVLGGVDAQQLTQAGRTLHGTIQKDLTSLETSYSQGHLRPKDLMLSYAKIAGKVNSLATQQVFKAQKEPTAQERFDQQLVVAPNGSNWVMRLGADGKTRSWQEVGSAPSEDQKGGGTFRQGVGFVHTMNGEEQTVPGLSLGDMNKSVEEQMEAMVEKPWVSEATPTTDPKTGATVYSPATIDFPTYYTYRSKLLSARIDSTRNAMTPESTPQAPPQLAAGPLQAMPGQGGPMQPGPQGPPQMQPGQPQMQPGQPPQMQQPGAPAQAQQYMPPPARVATEEEMRAEGPEAWWLDPSQVNEASADRLLSEIQTPEGKMSDRGWQMKSAHEAVMKNLRPMSKKDRVSGMIESDYGGFMPVEMVAGADMYRVATGKGDERLKDMAVPPIKDEKGYEDYVEAAERIEQLRPDGGSGALLTQYYEELVKAAHIWHTKQRNRKR